jgi:hypothetical protein
VSIIYKAALLWLVVVSGFCSLSAEADTDPCFQAVHQNKVSCQIYKYDKVNFHFRDSMDVEQKVLAKRVWSKQSGKLLHVDYDFEVHCHPQLNCANTNSLTTTVLWAFRNAVLENLLYTATYLPCDPLDGQSCLDAGKAQLIAASEVAESTLAKQPTHRKKESSVNKTELVTTTLDEVMRNSRNGSEFLQQNTERVFVDMPKFAYAEANTGSYIVCQLLKSGSCQPVKGRLTYSGRSGYAEFSHNQGQDFNKGLHNFLWNFFVENRAAICSEEMKCDFEKGCSIHMSCETP